VNVIS
jgi:hypothetical protein